MLSKKLCIIVLIFFMGTASASTQNTEPIRKEKLLENLKKAKQTLLNKNDYRHYIDTLIEEISQRGVDFRMSPDDETEFRRAGANDRILSAISSNYRRSRPPSVDLVRPTPTPTPVFTPLPEGPPISFDVLDGWLKRRASDNAITLAVYKRKVDFILDDTMRRNLDRAGASKSLVTAIEDSPAPSLLLRLSKSNCTRAEALLNESKFNEAQTLLEQAIKYDSENSNAYRLRAELNLYKNLQINAASVDMNQAIKMGGEASIRATYDCGGKDICPGKIFVGPKRVLFRPDNGAAWDIDGYSIKEVKAGGKRYTKEAGGFIITTKKTAAKDSLTFNFQAYSSSKEVRDLIVALIKSNIY